MKIPPSIVENPYCQLNDHYCWFVLRLSFFFLSFFGHVVRLDSACSQLILYDYCLLSWYWLRCTFLNNSSESPFIKDIICIFSYILQEHINYCLYRKLDLPLGPRGFGLGLHQVFAGPQNVKRQTNKWIFNEAPFFSRFLNLFFN